MPRIDPLQLLKCLSVLLTPDGGILSREEVPRLVNLMTKFSKKLVSKCVYVLILKNTETGLVDMFMAEGGWALIQTWMQDAVHTSNWDLVREILGLLLVTPVDVERLKLNILPKLIKSLSRREELEGVAQLSTQLVQQWLTIVKGTSAAHQANIAAEQAENKESSVVGNSIKSEIPDVNIKTQEAQVQNLSEGIDTSSFYKTTDKDGKLIIRRLSNETDKQEEAIAVDSSEESVKVVKDEEVQKEDRSKSSSSRSSRSSKSSSSNREKDKDRYSRDKDRKKSSSSSSKHTSSSSSKSRGSSSSKDKDRMEKDKQRSNGSLKPSSSSSSSSNKDKKDSKDKEKDKENQAEKDKDTLEKIKPPTIDRLGRIPRKSVHTPPADEKKDLKKKSFSVGIRKDAEDRPKTVKVFNSKMRSTGLEEEVKPAPPRSSKKPTPSVQLPTIPTRRPSPPKEQRELVVPSEKKLKMDKMDVPERPGAIKLIPPKPKPMLQESDLFMDALTAATTKKEPKKRKRRPSLSKDTTASPTASPAREAPHTSPQQSNAGGNPLGLKNIAPINFYQDTLSEEGNANKEDDKDNNTPDNVEVNTTDDQEAKGAASPQDDTKTPTDDKNEDEVTEPKRLRLDGSLKGVLLFTKKKGPKRSISWRNESDLVQIRYFELDETERVNVTKTFGDMARMEMTSEREAIQLSRKTVGEDLMESQIMWRLPYELELEDPPAIPGYKSLEKDIQFAREKSVLQALYFDKRRIPDSPEEAPLENHQMSDPVIIPLDDPDSQEIDLKSTPWPEPKGPAPLPEPQMPPQIFPNIQAQFTPQFNNIPPPAFQGMPPRYPLPNGPIGPPGNFGPPNMMPNGNMMGPPNMPPPNEMMNMNSNMFPPGGPMSDGYGPGPGPGPDYPMFNPNMANNMNMFPPKNFNNHRNNRGGGGGGGFRRGGNNSGNWVRMPGNNNWKRGGGGGGYRGGRLCKNVQNHGFCRNRENCPFVHP